MNGTRTVTQTFNAANQVDGFSYDAAGNLTNDGTTTFTYDALNRMIGSGGTTYTYNGDGVLVDDGTTQYTQDLASPLSQVLQTTQGSTTTSYLYGLDRLAAVTGSTRTWYGTDALGSVRLTISAAGLPLSIVNYDPWGTVESGSVSVFGFTGELQRDDRVYLRARWYATGQGRFTARDSFAGVAETPYSLHPYAYGYSDPVFYKDPSGRYPVDPDDHDKDIAVPKPHIVSRKEWGAVEPEAQIRVACVMGACGAEYGEGFYDPIKNPTGYACYSDLLPGRSLPDILTDVVIHHEGNSQIYYFVQAYLMDVMTGYNFLSLMRASAVVKRHSTVASTRFRPSSQAATSCMSVRWSGIRRLRHCRLSTLNSIAAMFNQLPCFGV